MAPPPPPELIEDAIAEILTRLPPDDPACLQRAAFVCKTWRRVLSDPAFLRRRRAFHRSPPPLLGFFCNVNRGRGSRFVPTTSFRLPEHNSKDHVDVVDCRHGLALLSASPSLGLRGDGRRRELLVWDPMDGGRRKLHVPGFFPFVAWNAAVLRGAGCDEEDRLGGAHFIVIFVGTDVAGCFTFARACVYASDSGAWSWPVMLHLGSGDVVLGCGRQSILVGEALYFLRMEDHLAVRYGKASPLGYRPAVREPKRCSHGSRGWRVVCGRPE
ncbi:unnamed protein product [Urochloa humidicola]